MKIHTKIYTLAVAAVMLALASPVQAQDWYVSGGIGASLTPKSDASFGGTAPVLGKYSANGEYDPGNTANFSLATGKEITNNVRTELELSHRKTKIKGFGFDRATIGGQTFRSGTLPTSGNLKTTALLVNGYYDFNIDQASLKPYVSAGLGLARHKGTFNATASVAGATASISAKVKDTVFAYQLGTGVSFGMSENTDLVAGYRYLATADAKSNGTNVGYKAHEINVGVRYGF